MATGSQIIAKARQFIGYGASTFTKWFGCSSSVSWCVIFWCYILNLCGISVPKMSWVPTAQQYCIKHGTMVKMANARPGDTVIFTWNGGGNNTGTGSRDHIGFIIKNNGNGTFTTIEGNTSGGRVAIRVRAAKYIFGIYHLNSVGSGSTTPTAPKKSTSTSSAKYVVGRTYTIVEPTGLKVRTGAGTGYRWKKRSELTTDGRRHSASGTYAVLVKGTQVTCQAVSGNWLRIPSGWICGREGSRVYVK